MQEWRTCIYITSQTKIATNTTPIKRGIFHGDALSASGIEKCKTQHIQHGIREERESIETLSHEILSELETEEI